MRWPLGTHREAGAYALVIHLSRRLGLDLQSWARRQGKKKLPSHWTQQGTDSIVVVMVMMLVIEQHSGHGALLCRRKQCRAGHRAGELFLAMEG